MKLSIGWLLLSAFAVPAMATDTGKEVTKTQSSASAATAAATCPAFLNHEFRRLHSKESLNLCSIAAGKPLLIVNTASHCGFTPQFEGLEALYKEFGPKGLVVVGFPSDDFFQEEKDEKDTAKICYINYGVTFPMLATSEVRGDGVNPVFAYLGEKAGAPKWNFYKYLVSADGTQVQAFNSKVKPQSAELTSAIEAILPKQ